MMVLYNVVIHDVLGKVIAKENNATTLLFFNAKNWSKGVYIITAIEQSTNTKLQDRLLIQ